MENVKKLLLALYKNPNALDRIDDIACRYCTQRDRCTAEDNGVCPQTDEEAIDIFIKHGLKDLMDDTVD